KPCYGTLQNIEPLEERSKCCQVEWRDACPTPTLKRNEPFGGKTNERLADWSSRDAKAVRQRHLIELRPWFQVQSQDAAPQQHVGLVATRSLRPHFNHTPPHPHMIDAHKDIDSLYAACIR